MEELKAFLKNTYTEKRTLDYHANQLFSTKQSKVESVSEWIRVQKLGSKFREAALQDCEQDEAAGILTLADKLRNICFVQGLYSDRIQPIVKSRNHSSFDEIAETALEEESAVFSMSYKNKTGSDLSKCCYCNKLGHAAKCYLKDRKDTQVNHLSVKQEHRESSSDVICYNCQGKGHMARHCRKPKKRLGKPGSVNERDGSSNYSGHAFQPSVSGSRPTVQSTQ